MKTKKVKSWKGLLEVFGGYGKLDVIYRGVANADYELLTKVGRKNAFRTGWSISAEKHLLTRFRRLALPHIKHQPTNSEFSDWLVIGQHHGLPTRLLDWTENPLAATFFAVQSYSEENKKINAAIYIEALPKNVTTSVSAIFDIEETEFLFPAHIANRVTAQSGVFTAHPNPTIPYDSKTLIKIVIPYGLKDEIQAELHNFGVNKALLFPDLDGIAAFIEWQFRYLIEGPEE